MSSIYGERGSSASQLQSASCLNGRRQEDDGSSRGGRPDQANGHSNGHLLVANGDSGNEEQERRHFLRAEAGRPPSLLPLLPEGMSPERAATIDPETGLQSFYFRERRRRNRDLRDLIRSQSDCGGILDLVRERGYLWDAISLSTALHTIAWKSRAGGQPPDFQLDARWKYFMQLVHQKLDGNEARNLANNIWSLASLACHDDALLDLVTSLLPAAAATMKPQEVANTCWALATLKWKDDAIFEVLAAEISTKAEEGINQDLTNTLWAFATVSYVPEKIFLRLCMLAAHNAKDFKPQELANAIWAMATATLPHDGLICAVSRHTLEHVSEFLPQNLANFLWAYAKLGYDEDVVIHHLQQEAGQRLQQFSAQDLSTTLWSFSTMAHRSDEFLVRGTAELTKRLRSSAQGLQAQHVSNSLWALASVLYYEECCFRELTTSAVGQLQAFKAQELSNTIWACAVVQHNDQKVTDALVLEVAQRLPEFDTQGIGNSTWAAAQLQTSVAKLYDAVWMRLRDYGVLEGLSEKAFSMLSLAFLNAGRADLGWGLLDFAESRSVAPGVAPLGSWWFWSSRLQPNAEREMQVLAQLAKTRPCRNLMVTILNAAIMRLDELGHADAAWQLLERVTADGAADVVSELLRCRLLAAERGRPPSQLLRYLTGWRVPHSMPSHMRCDYDKECQVLRHVLATAQQGDPESVLRAIENFSFEGSRWLKIAGDEKGAVLDDIVTRLAPPKPKLIVEFGCYVGYSSCRMARLLRQHGGRIISVEVDPIHACISRSTLEFAGLLEHVSIFVGHSEHAIPLLAEVCGGQTIDAVFMDQKGTRFHIDLDAMEERRLLSPGCAIVADNVLKPGAPHFLWRLQHSERYSLTVVSLREFAAETVEDWMSVAKIIPERQTAKHPPFPEMLSEVAFFTDHSRSRSCAGKRPGEMGEGEWSRHSQDLRDLYELAGITPQIVQVRRMPDGRPYVDWQGFA
eukprot:TRINITY_DN13321_c0_g1_i1.p1 TRINITY_DN13321_c0_g1~~TRINITY_DN13321_c0_g1_i1.p1  ORF type:complete len:971 (-),score=216.78 TRINITY_DN13321_c0_g1_i1:742-3654(-)